MVFIDISHYWALPHFITISINSSQDNLCSLRGWWKDHLRTAVWRFSALSLPHISICASTYNELCGSSSVSWSEMHGDGNDPRRRGAGGRGLLRMNGFTDGGSSGQSVFTAQSLNRAGLSIRPLSIWRAIQGTSRATDKTSGTLWALVAPFPPAHASIKRFTASVKLLIN